MSSLLTFSVIYTFDFYIASEELKIYQNNLIKKVPDFLLLEKFIHDKYLSNSFLQGLLIPPPAVGRQQTCITSHLKK